MDYREKNSGLDLSWRLHRGLFVVSTGRGLTPPRAMKLSSRDLLPGELKQEKKILQDFNIEKKLIAFLESAWSNYSVRDQISKLINI